ncbi:hypothetical protein M078_4449 [Bacteroides fragilis str. 2-F-2 |nr:hypothetical protein M078_4449 [Bacteroides fragilis str. 2-F-2 \
MFLLLQIYKINSLKCLRFMLIISIFVIENKDSIHFELV